MNDLISRSELLKWFEAAQSGRKAAVDILVINDAIEVIKAAPAVDPVVYGKNISQSHPVDEFECSVCGVILEGYTEVKVDDHDNDRSNMEYVFGYCPHCGAKMDLEEQP